MLSHDSLQGRSSERRHRASLRPACLAAGLLQVTACYRWDFEELLELGPAQVGVGGSFTPTSGGGAGGSAGSAVLVAGGDAGGAGPSSVNSMDGGAREPGASAGIDAGTLGDAGAFDAGSTGDAATADNDAGPELLPCTLTGSEGVVEHFDTDTTGGVSAVGEGSPSITWSPATGHPSPGSLRFDNALGGTARIEYASPPADMSNRPTSSNVFVATGSDVELEFLLETGPSLIPATGATLRPPQGQWVCLRLDPAAPAAAGTGYDPGDARRLSIVVRGTGALRVHVDQSAF